MPADYFSAAKALALPTSPSPSPSPSPDANPDAYRPPWSRGASTSTRRLNNTSPYSQRASAPRTYKAQLIHSALQTQRYVTKTISSLTPLQRLAALAALALTLTISILFLIYSPKIFGWLAPTAKKWHALPGGWLLLWLLTFICAFPPLIGYSTSVTISGFVYGFPAGWFIVSTATVAGSLASFVASRTVLAGYVQRLVGGDRRFEALALTLKHDGLKILCMIRFCPLPYSLSNAAMSTFPTVHPLSFALATAIASPKLLIHVFIGSRLAAIADSSEEGAGMDAGTKAVNYFSIVLGSVLGAVVGWTIYRRTMARARELEAGQLEGGVRVRGPGSAEEGGYSDGGGADPAALMDPDDISLWDNDDEDDDDVGFAEPGEVEGGAQFAGYRDEEPPSKDVFADGDGGDVGRR